MKQVIYTVEEQSQLAPGVFRMRLGGDTSAVTRPGQFVNFRLDGRFLRRPISVCDYDDGQLTVIYKVVGAGTGDMSRMRPGQTIDTLVGLGNGYDVSFAGDSPLLLGGGVGVPPLFRLARDLIQTGAVPTVVLGFNKSSEIFYEKEFSDLGCRVYVSTVDGSYGEPGFVTDVMKKLTYSYFFTCGPEPMLRAVFKTSVTSGQLSFERRMGCGFGACMGCSCKTVTGNKRICKEGPILFKEDIIWDV